MPQTTPQGVVAPHKNWEYEINNIISANKYLGDQTGNFLINEMEYGDCIMRLG